MQCLKCGGRLIEDSNDCRQEWRRIYYHCDVCGLEHERYTVYKIQSSLVESDKMTATDPETGKLLEE